MVVAQTVVLLVVDVACIVTASTVGSSSQKWWFLTIPSGSFVLETAVGTRDIMHVFIEVLLTGIFIAAYLAAMLIGKMRQKKRLLQAKYENTIVGSVNGQAGSGLSDGRTKEKQNGSMSKSASPSSRGKDKRASREQQIQASLKQRTISGSIDGIEIEVAALFLLTLTVIGAYPLPCTSPTNAHLKIVFACIKGSQ